MPLDDEPDELDLPVHIVDAPLTRICGRDAWRYAAVWGLNLDNDIERKIFDIETKFMVLAHSKAEDGLPFSERIDLEAFAEKWRPATYAEALRALAEDIRREREGRSLRRLGPGFKTIPGGRS
jgi:hypothetical protein